jgi:ABC-type transporter Mla subunit MlaD
MTDSIETAENKQISELSKTVQTQTQRLDQGLKLLDETLQICRDLSSKMEVSISEFKKVSHSLAQAQEEVEAQLDDLAKITAAQMTLYQAQKNR